MSVNKCQNTFHTYLVLTPWSLFLFLSGQAAFSRSHWPLSAPAPSHEPAPWHPATGCWRTSVLWPSHQGQIPAAISLPLRCEFFPLNPEVQGNSELYFWWHVKMIKWCCHSFNRSHSTKLLIHAGFIFLLCDSPASSALKCMISSALSSGWRSLSFDVI